MNEFFRFPRTPHVAWLSPGSPRDDKLLTPDEAHAFLTGDVIVEEKIDGANLGFSLSSGGTLQAQNRGHYIDLDQPDGQWRPLRVWLGTRRFPLIDALGPDLILFGEWCYALHSVSYTHLPDWFIVFDVYDRKREAFWSTARRDAFAAELGLSTVPELARGCFNLDALKALIGPSRLTEGTSEGVYLRREAGGWLEARAKLVRPSFVQAIEEHWSKRGIQPNALADPRLG